MIVDSDIERLFSESVWMRAHEYARSKRVSYLGVKRTGKHGRNEEHLFSANGSDNREYKISVRPGALRGDIRAKCSCPYEQDGYCKHIGAALISGVNEDLFSLIDYYGSSVDKSIFKDFIDNDRPGVIEEKKRDIVIDLSRQLNPGSNKSRSLSEVLPRPDTSRPDTLFPEPADPSGEHAKEKPKYTIVFFVEITGMQYSYYANTTDPLRVSPGVRYIKKDGTPGRYESYRDSRNIVSPTDSERNIVSWLLDTDAKGVPFGYVLPHLIDDPDLRLVSKNGNSYAPLSVEKLQSVNVSFVFDGLQDKYTPVFKPRLVFNPENARSKVDTGIGVEQTNRIPVDGVEYGESGIGIYFYSHTNETIYYSTSDPLDTRYLTRILQRYRKYSIDDIRAISSGIRSSFLTIDRPLGKIYIKNTQPGLTLYLEVKYEHIIIRPAFTYGTRTVDREQSAQLLTGDQEGEVLTVYARAPLAEDRLLDWIADLMADKLQSHHPYSLQMDVPEFLHRYGDDCTESGVELFLKDRPIKRLGTFNIVASSGIDWLDLKFTVDDQRVSPRDIDLLRGTVSVDGTYCLLDHETLEKLRALYSSGSVGRETIRLSRFDLVTISQIESLIDADEDGDLARIRSALAKLEQGFDTNRLRRSKGMVGVLRPYQKSGVKWLKFLSEYGFGGILADDMGLGKTIQAIALLAHLSEQGITGPFLVVAPVSTIPNWIREIERFTPNMEAYPHVGPGRPSDSETIATYRGVAVTSYHTLQRDIELFEPVVWSQLILDESQALKNPTAKTHRTVRRLTVDRILAMSGTPVENNIQELWSIMSILNPGLLGSKNEFMKKFRRRISDGDETAIEDLRSKLRPFLLRRTKEQVAPDLPPKEELSIEVSLSVVERKFYDSLREKLRDEVRSILMSEEPFKAATAILAALTKLRQAAIAPSLVGGPSRSSKLDAIVEKLDEAVSEGHKTLVFSQYVRILKMLVDRVEAQSWTYRYLDGSITSGKRKKIIDEFQNESEVNIFLISLKAGGVGINLTEADYVFLVDPWWNPAVETQAIDRTHRIGQTKPVFAYRFITENTIEERILELQGKKRELVKQVIGEDNSVFKSLSKDEIIGLFD